MPKPLKPRRASSTVQSIKRQAKRVKVDVAKSDTQNLKKLLTTLGLAPEKYDLSTPFSVEMMLSVRVMRNILKYHNEGNRKIDRRQVDSLARSFNSTGYIDIDPFLVDTSGNFLNGQHRMTAAVREEIPIYVTIKFAMPPETRLITDNGRKKRPNDALDFLGVTHGEHILSIYKGALDGHGLDFKHKADWEVACCPHKTRNTNWPADEILDIYHKYQDAFDFVSNLFHSDKCLWGGNSSIKGAFFRAYIYNPILYKPVLEEIIRYKNYPNDSSDDIKKVRILTAFDGKIKKAGAKTKESQVFAYALTESLILTFAKPSKQMKNTRICPVLDEAFPYPALDYRHAGAFVSGPDKRRLERLNRGFSSNDTDMDDYDVA